MSHNNTEICPRCGDKMEVYEKSGLLLCSNCQYFVKRRS